MVVRNREKELLVRAAAPICRCRRAQRVLSDNLPRVSRASPVPYM